VKLPAAPFFKPATFAEGQAPTLWKRPQPALQPPSSILQGQHDDMTSTDFEWKQLSGTTLASSLWKFNMIPPTNISSAVFWHAQRDQLVAAHKSVYSATEAFQHGLDCSEKVQHLLR